MADPVQSQEDLDKILKSGVKPIPVQAPSYYATSIRLLVEPTNASISFSRNQPVDISYGQNVIHASTLVPVAIIDMSPQTAKDLYVLLKEQIESYEQKWGEIRTEYTSKMVKK